MESAILVAIIAVVGGLPAIVLQRRTEREKLTESRVVDLLNRQDTNLKTQGEEIAQLQRRDREKDQKLREQDLKIAEMAAENKKMWRLFTLAIENLAEWIRWDRNGRRGWPPETPRELRHHLPDEAT